MMNLTRRRFFRGLALAPVAVVVAAKLPPLPAPKKKMLAAAFRTRMPSPQWRHIGRPSLASLKDMINLLRSTNEITHAMKWTDG